MQCMSGEDGIVTNNQENVDLICGHFHIKLAFMDYKNGFKLVQKFYTDTVCVLQFVCET